MMEGVYLLLGSNLGDKKTSLTRAKKTIESRIGNILKHSSIYETAAWGKTDQPTFLNEVIEIKTNLQPSKLLNIINEIEKNLGRTRIEKWGERKIDIDILYYGQLIVDRPDLKIPHPGIPQRRFTLVPLVEIAADFYNPISLKTNKELLDECSDTLKVEKVG